ncbi:MAG: hypothetical protein MAG715_00603 [Methanonatronarchaeales archaeon]|nr:hypothetical protein [Methanonatronarchaeales archaeon]
MIDENCVSIELTLPLPTDRVFRNQAMQDVLTLLVKNLNEEFTVTELREISGHGGETVDVALRLLNDLDLIRERREGRRRLIRINQKRVESPREPILKIPQEEYRAPVYGFLDELAERNVEPETVVLFGSVARGAADRRSDIDLLLIYETVDPATRQEVQDARKNVENRRFGGERYVFQTMVKSRKGVQNYGPKMRDILMEGIALKGDLDDVTQGVLDGQKS